MAPVIKLHASIATSVHLAETLRLSLLPVRKSAHTFYREGGEADIRLAMEKSVGLQEHVSRAVEASIHIGLVILMTAACFLILRPFLPLIAWGIIIAIAVYPRYRQLGGALGGRGVLSAVLMTLVLLAFLIVPVVLLAGTLVGSIQTIAT